VDKVVEVTEDEFYESLWYRSSMIFTKDERRALKRQQSELSVLVERVELHLNS